MKDDAVLSLMGLMLLQIVVFTRTCVGLPLLCVDGNGSGTLNVDGSLGFLILELGKSWIPYSSMQP